MKKFYFGGQFNFRYKDYSIEKIKEDYRSRILGDYHLWMNTPSGVVYLASKALKKVKTEVYPLRRSIYYINVREVQR